MTIKEFFSLKTNRYFWGNLIAMFLVVVIAIFATLKGLDSYTLHGEAIEVPNAKGMSVEEAKRLFESKIYHAQLPTLLMSKKNLQDACLSIYLMRDNALSVIV